MEYAQQVGKYGKWESDLEEVDGFEERSFPFTDSTFAGQIYEHNLGQAHKAN